MKVPGDSPDMFQPRVLLNELWLQSDKYLFLACRSPPVRLQLFSRAAYPGEVVDQYAHDRFHLG